MSLDCEASEIMNKQEAIEKIKNIGTFKINDTVTHQQFDMVDKDKVLDIISKIHEQQKVVVPQFVADWYENNKYNIENSIYRLCAGFYSKTLDKEIYDWFGDPEINSIETLVKMKLYGYEVENEQQYVVAIPDDERNKFIQLWKNRKGKLLFNFEDKIRYGKVHLLTEQEIKQKDERLWQFAEEVEE